MGPSEITTILVAALAALSGVWGYLANRRAASIQREMPRLTAEAAAFSLAKDHYVNIINELEEHVAWLKNELADRSRSNAELRQRITDLEEAVYALKTQLESAVEALRNQSFVMVKQVDGS